MVAQSAHKGAHTTASALETRIEERSAPERERGAEAGRIIKLPQKMQGRGSDGDAGAAKLSGEEAMLRAQKGGHEAEPWPPRRQFFRETR